MRKLVTLSACLISAPVMVACGSAHLTDEGRKVKTITPDIAKSCSYLGVVFSSKPTMEGGERAVFIDARNRAAAAGANAILITANKHISPRLASDTQMSAEIYSCNFDLDSSSQRVVDN